MKIGPKIRTENLVSALFINDRHKKQLSLFYDSSVWTVGDIGEDNNPPFDSLGGATSEHIVSDLDPWGNTVPIWETHSISNGTGTGGIYCASKPVNSTKDYRVSYWENRVTNGDATYGNQYFGINAYGSPNGVQRYLNSTPNTNPYPWSGNLNTLTINTWFLISSVVRAHQTLLTTTKHEDSAVWNLNGTIYVNNSYEYAMFPGSTTLRPRTLNMYHCNGGDAKHHTFNPRMDLMDGTQPTIDDLLHNRTHRITDPVRFNSIYIKKSNYDDNEIIFNSETQDIVSMRNVPDLNNNFTISFWMYRTSTPSSGNKITLFSRDGNLSNNFSLKIKDNNLFEINQKEGVAQSFGTTAENNWWFVSIVMNNKIPTIYKWLYSSTGNSDTQITSDTGVVFANSFDDTGDMIIGAEQDSEIFSGKMMNIMIYDDVLSLEEIKEIIRIQKLNI